MRGSIPKVQTGQALPLGIALFFILGVMAFALFNTGQTVTSKTRIVNTADSAAYSGLLWQARAMNFTAYTNRAMVANEVAMAQAVSLHSWAGYLSLTGSNLDALLGKVPYIGVVTGILKAVSSTVDTFLTPISEGMLTVINSINEGISVAQESMYMATYIATPDVVNTVVSSNDVKGHHMEWDSGYSIMNSALNLNGWSDLTEQFDDGSQLGMHERGHMIRESMDRFSRERKWKFFNFFIPVTPLNWVRLEKDGTTVLLGNEAGDNWEWQANDAHSINVARFTWRGKKLDEVPVAGASSIANNQDSFDSAMGEDHRFHGARHKLAKKRRKLTPIISTHDGRQLDGYTGLHAYRALSKDWRQGDEPPSLKLKIEVTMNPENIISSDDITGRTQLTNNIDAPGNIISSISAAELFFERPCLDDTCLDSEEYADGYSPYWDVRLAKNSNASRLAAYALHGDTLTDNSHYVMSNVVRLPGYENASATPITDYQEQVEGVNRTLESMESHLQSLATDSPEFAAYQARLESIKSNINSSVSTLINGLIYDGLSEQDLIRSIAQAADFDFDVAEFEKIQEVVGDVYDGLVSTSGLQNLQDQFSDSISTVAQNIETDIRNSLEEKLRTAVEDIIENLLASAIESHTGVSLDDAALERVTNTTVENVLSTRVEPQHATDIPVDLRDECAVYEAVHTAEREVEKMQKRLETVNRAIALEFFEELSKVTQETIEQKQALTHEIETLNQYLNEPWSFRTYKGQTYSLEENFRTRIQRDLEQAELSLSNIYAVRVERLTQSLMVISDKHTSTIPEFSEFRLEYQFAHKAVIDILGDTTNLEVIQDSEIIADSLFFANVDEELNSDAEQTYTERPAAC